MSADVSSDFRPWRGPLCLVGCSLAISVGGIQLGGLGLVWGTQVLYVASYFHHFHSDATVQTMYLVFPVSGILFSLGSSTVSTAFLGTFAYHRFGARVVISLATVFLSLLLLSCSFMTNYITFMCVYSVFQGSACSCIIFPCLYPPWLFYPKRKGTVTGITMVAYAGGTALQGLAFTFLMNPANASPTVKVTTQSSTEFLFDFQIAQNCPFTFRVFALAFLIVGLTGAALISEPDNNENVRKTLSEASLAREEQAGRMRECPGIRTAAGTWTFWCLMLVNFLGYTYDFFLMVQYKSYASSYIENDHLLSIIGSVAQVGNVAGRLIMTVLVDYVSNRFLLLINCLGNAILALTLTLTIHSVWLYTLSVSLSFFFFGFSLSPTAVICGKVFGVKTGGKVLSFLMLGTLFGNLSTILITQTVMLPFGYDAAFFLLGLLSLAAAGVASTIKLHYDWTDTYSPIAE